MGERKVRSDKKRDVKVTVSIELKDSVYRLAFLTQKPVKDVCEQMIKYAMTDHEIVGDISMHFRRDIRIGNIFYTGSTSNVPVDNRVQGESERMSTRLNTHDYEVINALSYALDIRPARTSALLIEATMHDYRFINNYVKTYLHGSLDSEQMGELRSILKYVNEKNDEHYSWATLMSLIADKVTTPITRIKDAVNEFVVHNWRDK